MADSTLGEKPMTESMGATGCLFWLALRRNKKRHAKRMSPPTMPPTVTSTITSVLNPASSFGAATFPGGGATATGSDLGGGVVVATGGLGVVTAELLREDMGPNVEKCVVLHSMSPEFPTTVLCIFSQTGGFLSSLK